MSTRMQILKKTKAMRKIASLGNAITATISKTQEINDELKCFSRASDVWITKAELENIPMPIINDPGDIPTAPTAPTVLRLLLLPLLLRSQLHTIPERPIPSSCAHSAPFSECHAPPLKRPRVQAASTCDPSKAPWDIFVPGKTECGYSRD